MTDFNVRADAVDVDDIMRQIRTRIREKRGTDYTDAEVQKLASVKLEKFLDPKGIKSDLVDQFRKGMAGVETTAETVDEGVIYGTKPMVRRIRRLLNPILKLFFSPSALLAAAQASAVDRRRQDMLMYELVHNLVVEVTRLGIENHNMKMRLESLSGRLDFDERRGRALETVVQYSKPPVRQDSRPPQSRNDNRQDSRNSRNDRQRNEPRQQSTPAPAPVATPAPVVAVARDTAAPSPSQPMPAAASTMPSTDAPAHIITMPVVAAAPGTSAPDVPREGAQDGERRRRRRRRRRRPGQNMAGANGAPADGASGASAPGAADDAGDDGPDDGAAEE